MQIAFDLYVSECASLGSVYGRNFFHILHIGAWALVVRDLRVALITQGRMCSPRSPAIPAK